ncbi:hypothetical protein [Bradyrhizobium japonicum]|uniref:hypothetical protein n=2 Tax=Nitrobacteraceae TaxID=41294 RepID=UPI00209DD0AC|nr:hypothetical protein [Bradyrhizobium japonicum]WLC02261.1 hypothetical protein QIH92_24355 [Bradyrhizobium japonicum USDA 123]MCP1741692.1 putative membrane protein [Bradyrhizobium japonicum]MCP1779485.1 putative membrane protein [Bradyrhizobium japonicum]MCP1859402.1 putative membrane protein [Bradyrhizobium japonicum]MCP1890169.1 putative membrane protein [Bradyrhizobium japonicum]
MRLQAGISIFVLVAGMSIITCRIWWWLHMSPVIVGKPILHVGAVITILGIICVIRVFAPDHWGRNVWIGSVLFAITIAILFSMVDVMDQFWGWMALAVILAFAFLVLAVRMLSNKPVGIGYFAGLGVVGALLLICILLMVSTIGNARNFDGRYSETPLKPWFDKLRSALGPCCSDADGYAIADADWESRDGRFRVRIPRSNEEADKNILIWVDVPDAALITVPNRAGRTMVWPIWGYQEPSIRCFMPGSMT